jgi:hypothetical protein
MDELTKTMNKMHIQDKNPYNSVIPEQVLKMIHSDIEYMFTQIINDQQRTTVFELFKNMYMFNLEEIKMIHDYITKYGLIMLVNRFKNSGLYYTHLDLETYMDYYIDEIYDMLSLMDGC